jgi:hypothetical protein
MGLFNIKNDQIILDPDSLAIPVFKTIWDNDKTKGKARATQVISYIYYMSDFKSPYSIYPEKKRKEILKEEFIKDKEWKEGINVDKAIQTYRGFQETHTMRLMRAARAAADQLSIYFEDVDFKEKDDQGRPVYTAKDVATSLEKVGKIVESLDKLEEKIKKEIKSESRVRGGGDIGIYER